MFESPTSPYVKIIDFGLSCRYNPDRPMHAQFGTLQTMAPEVFGGNYTSQCDLWSLGVLTFELLCGRKPFATSNLNILTNNISMAHYKFDAPGWKGKSKSAKDFCRALLKHDPQARPTAQQALKHTWLVNTKAVTENVEPMLHELHAYAKAPMIEKIVRLIVAHKAFPKDILNLRRQFEELDSECSGVISLKDFIEVVANNCSVDEVYQIFDSMDAYQDGEVRDNLYRYNSLSLRRKIYLLSSLS